MTQPSLNSVVDYGDTMLQMPKSALRIFEMTTSEDVEVEDLVEVIQVDPTFTARLLQSVNSAANSRGIEITSIREAVTRIGMEGLAQLAAMLATVSEVKKLECNLLKIAGYWRHSLTTALIAKSLAKRFGVDADGCFLAGLLHDLGKPIEFHLLGDQMMHVLESSLLGDHEDFADAEQNLLGFSHSDVGALIGERWNLPVLVIEAIRFHHQPDLAERYVDEVAVVALANAMESLVIDDEFEDYDKFEVISGRIDQRFRLELSEVFEVLKIARASAESMMEA